MEIIDKGLVKFWIEEGILHNELKHDIVITPDTAKELIEQRHKISNGENQYWCFSIDNITSFTREGIKYVEVHGQDFLNATAIITDSKLKKLMFNFFSNIHATIVPTQAFNTKEDAIKWLKQKMEENERIKTAK
mgnify:CR=1 FL=1